MIVDVVYTSVRPWRFRLAVAAVAYGYFLVSGYVRSAHFVDDQALWTYETSHNQECREGYAHLAREAILKGDAALGLRRLDAIRLDDRQVRAFVDREAMAFYRARAIQMLGDIDTAYTAFLALAKAGRQQVRSESFYQLALVDFRRSQYRDMHRNLSESLRNAASHKIQDQLLLRSYASHRLGIDPCVDFRTLTIGELDVGLVGVRRQIFQVIQAVCAPPKR